MKLGQLIDLDTCVGCHACATACKEWNGASAISGPLADYDPYGAEPSGVWLNRVRHYEVGAHPDSKTINFPMSCLHCEEAACVTVCPTGASCSSTRTSAWDATCARGRARTARASSTTAPAR